MATSEQLAADPVTLHQLFSADNILLCPLFQRPYVWKRDNILGLWADIDTVLDEERDVRFLGALVFDNESASTSSAPGYYWVIDGQQRLTTLFLSLCALAVVAREADHADASKALIDEYLVSRKASARMEPKLLTTLRDTKQFNRVLLESMADRVKVTHSKEAGTAEGTLLDAYEIVKSEVRRRCRDETGNFEKERVERLRDVLLERLEFVEIRLGQKHDANEVFDRLNKEGLRLGIVDLVRNEVLKRLRSDVSLAEDVYSTQWRPFENSFETTDSMEGYFFPHALTKDSSITKSRTFKALAQRWKSDVGTSASPAAEIATIMKDLGEHVAIYRHIRDGAELKGVSGKYAEALQSLSRMSPPSVILPYLFSLHSAVETGAVAPDQAATVVSLVETFLVRRAISGIEPTGLHAVFKGLWGVAGADLAKVRTQLENKTVKFPSDAEFEAAVKTAPMYTRKIRNFAMLEYERSFTKGDVLRTFPAMTADHVLPQSAKGAWTERFSAEEIAKLSDTWANLVPLSGKANSEKGAKTYADVRSFLKTETVFSSTKRLADQCEDWNSAALRARADVLSAWAVGRWPDIGRSSE